MFRILALAALLIVTALPVTAGHKEGIAAYNRGDYRTALRAFKPLAAGGYAKAQHFLGAMYAKGRGVRRNYVLAYLWWSLAAAQSNKNAATKLGLIEMRMTRADVSRAQAMAAKWRPSLCLLR